MKINRCFPLLLYLMICFSFSSGKKKNMIISKKQAGHNGWVVWMQYMETCIPALKSQ